MIFAHFYSILSTSFSQHYYIEVKVYLTVTFELLPTENFPVLKVNLSSKSMLNL